MGSAVYDPWQSVLVASDVAWATHASAQALAARRTRRLSDLLRRAARDCPLYRRMLAGWDLSRVQLSDLPVMRKADLLRRFDEGVTDPRLRLDELRRFTADVSRIAEPYLGRYVVWESSGSSGEPCIFVQDAAAMAVYDALEGLRRPVIRPLERFVDPWYASERIALVGATGGHFASIVSAQRLRRLNPAVARRVHCVSFLQPVAQLVDELHAVAPTIIGTYPSAALLLAEEHAAGRLKAKPQEIWTGGETLTPAVRAFVEQTFGCPVIDSYGASEFFALACQCRRGRLHLNSDWAILEPVDERGHAVPPGTAGATTLLTNLANHVQPLIRYDLGDRVALHARTCECGSALPMIDVQGRSDDSLVLRTPNGGTVRVLPLALTTVIEGQAHLFDFQLEQTGPSQLSLCTALEGAAAIDALGRARSALALFLARQGAQGVAIDTKSAQAHRCGRGGKVQRVTKLAS